MEHPSRKILASQTDALRGKRIVLGVTSSVALYRSIDLARLIMKNGGEVTVVMSRDAASLVSPVVFEWATGNRVYHTRFGGEVGHIALSETHDAMLIAPATLNTLSKIAYGIADSPVSLTAISFLGKGKPVIVAPSMHMQLYDSVQAENALRTIGGQGVIIHDGVVEGDKLKFPPIEHLEWHLETVLNRGKDYRGVRVLVTGGPTREYIDDVRFISNPSSGLMGYSLALEAFFRGAETYFIHGPLSFTYSLPRGLRDIYVETTDEMLSAVLKTIDEFRPDIIVMSAAPSDFNVVERSPGKLPSDSELSLRLKPSKKILAEAKEKAGEECIVVGFAAETADSLEELRRKALAKKNKYRIDVLVANNVARKDIGFSSAYNEAIVITDSGEYVFPRSPKKIIARRILDVVGDMFLEGKTGS